MAFASQLGLSGQRLGVTYRLQGSEQEARAKAEDICLEQTVEFPRDLLPAGDICEHLVGRIEALVADSPGSCQATISFALETTGLMLPQLLNVVFGNISMKPGIRVEWLDLPESLLGAFKGPRFGRAGLRERLGVRQRPLLCAVLKMMGASPRELAEQAYCYALGGADLIKDDHGLADQSFAPFRERVERCAEAVRRANRETGLNSLYLANVLVPSDRVAESARFAKEVGAGGLLVCAGILGWDTLRSLAGDDQLGLPIMAHPSFLGNYGINLTNGISYFALYGQIARLAGADAIAFPNHGGRFAYTRHDCIEITRGTQVEMGRLAPIFPAPGGGLKLERMPDILSLYGRDVILLVGGDLHRRSPDLVKNSRYFREMLENA